MATKIIELDERGGFEEVALYSLPPKRALIAHYMQHVKRNGNTWDYPDDLHVIQALPSGTGYSYQHRESTFIAKEDTE